MRKCKKEARQLEVRLEGGREVEDPRILKEAGVASK